MFRTYDHSQQFEKGFDQFMAMRPCARLYITATPVPAALALKEEMDAGLIDDIKFWVLESCEDYIGVEEMVSHFYDGIIGWLFLVGFLI